jgi:Beta-fructosidases (levanase/invertase)
MLYKLATLTVSLVLLIGAGQRPDILIADFEGKDYGAWVVTGEAFWTGPALGTLPGQQTVSGFRGHGLVNTFFNGDGTTGTLTSPPFKIERRFINFLVGGGAHKDKTCANLLVEGKVVRSTTGSENERLEWATWDVEEFSGKAAQIQIVDNETGGWGHINVDEIRQSDRRLTEDIKTSPLYGETFRPQFHFTAQKGWMNDPNGLVWLDGEYHLFFQHNPKGTEWGNMTWGHAVSTDLLHWQQLPNALEPDKLGTMFSGSAVIDERNTAGFGKKGEKPLVCIYTAAGGTSDESKGQPFTQCIAYSLDKGRTFTKYSGNPVLKHVAGENRDPKVVWHAPTRRWIMALYLTGNDYGLFSSPDLKQWTELQRVHMPDCSECPDFLPIKVDGSRGTTKWIITAANGRYVVGDFDGRKYSTDGKVHQVEFGANCYAVQTYSGIPGHDGRRIQMAWMNGGSFPRMPFNQQMAIPCELTLRRTTDGLRLYKQPVRELSVLRSAPHMMRNDGIVPARNDSETWKLGTTFEVQLDVEIGEAREFEMKVFGEPIVYSKEEGALKALGRSAKLPLANGKLHLQILVDRTSLEVFGNAGQVALTSSFRPRWDEKPLDVQTAGGVGRMSLTAWPLKSVWPAH